MKMKISLIFAFTFLVISSCQVTSSLPEPNREMQLKSVSVEENIEDEFDQSILLADEKAMSSEESPFSNVNSLSNYVASLLENVSE